MFFFKFLLLYFNYWLCFILMVGNLVLFSIFDWPSERRKRAPVRGMREPGWAMRWAERRRVGRRGDMRRYARCEPVVGSCGAIQLAARAGAALVARARCACTPGDGRHAGARRRSPNDRPGSKATGRFLTLPAVTYDRDACRANPRPLIRDVTTDQYVLRVQASPGPTCAARVSSAGKKNTRGVDDSNT
jgi:hypothetical protein